MDPMEDPMELDPFGRHVSTVEQFILDFPEHPNEIIHWVRTFPMLVMPIVDQGTCGFCWALVCAYAITIWSNLLHFYKRGEFMTEIWVSAQELLNRVSLHYPWYHRIADMDIVGCYPSHPILGFDFARNHGLPYEDELPNVYHRMIVPVHVQENEYPRIKISGCESLGDWSNPLHRELIINNFRVTQLVACIATTQRFMDFDGEGIFEAFPCEKIIGYHSVIVLVLNLEDNYFIIRNTWSTRWAKNGFAKVKCDQFYNFSRPTGSVTYMRDSQLSIPI